jgi:hypothetical protein
MNACPADHRRRGPVRSQAAHWPEPCLESAVIAFDPVVRVLGRVVERVGEEVVDDAQQRSCEVSGDLARTFTTGQHCLEEPGGRCDVSAFRHEDVDDLAVLVDCPVDVPPCTGHLDVGFIDEPAITDTVPARPCPRLISSRSHRRPEPQRSAVRRYTQAVSSPFSILVVTGRPAATSAWLNSQDVDQWRVGTRPETRTVMGMPGFVIERQFAEHDLHLPAEVITQVSEFAR